MAINLEDVRIQISAEKSLRIFNPDQNLLRYEIVAKVIEETDSVPYQVDKGMVARASLVQIHPSILGGVSNQWSLFSICDEDSQSLADFWCDFYEKGWQMKAPFDNLHGFAVVVDEIEFPEQNDTFAQEFIKWISNHFGIGLQATFILPQIVVTRTEANGATHLDYTDDPPKAQWLEKILKNCQFRNIQGSRYMYRVHHDAPQR